MHLIADKLPLLFMQNKAGQLVKVDANRFKKLLSQVLVLDTPKPPKKERGYGSMLSREEKLIRARLQAQGEL
jgi:hypothetical protein